jgi:hypothetical protein
MPFITPLLSLATSFAFDSIIIVRWVQIFEMQVEKARENMRTFGHNTKNDGLRSDEMVMSRLGSTQYCLIWWLLPHLFHP